MKKYAISYRLGLDSFEGGWITVIAKSHGSARNQVRDFYPGCIITGSLEFEAVTPGNKRTVSHKNL